MHTKTQACFKSLFFLSSLALICILYSQLSWAQLTLQKSQQKRYPIENKQINESSGLACSTRDKQVLWTHNDSGHMPIIYALNSKGKDLGTFHLEGIESNDWEDMDAFKYQGNHYLLIADTGDNYRFRWDYQMTIIKEPSVNKAFNNSNNSAISPAWSFAFKYENDQSYDVEAVAVDSVHEKIVLSRPLWR
ncbi:MAG: hypothetical protein KZQ64_05060 [gamma proteobacterium symbiont of Bathyaustriella thionipta]|nr:hypothetical protein [gamma proteobacterium symbiont of Bathyaustriella thionipta]MCU7950852.1 hypothetical protein [gamma proteobacterium symbiont of Bathyaustriella thionipta]MCU7952747.1 hypothetical protein [gamma proteobacterium symbiont of Bathyaustriella thionipta]MCU7957466.1 hypothetical protein [gamma proteobacterium symbiont of Bathyaustriella thionipta]MCU7968689.1 hypothetical protein [gamma proteobacterium symbiont of Bathyaustriella thionipta]